jgi:CRP-like cAMP-binding protein
VDEGVLEVLVEGPSGEHTVSTLGPGDLFGEMALLGGGARNATVRARTPCRLFSLVGSDLRSVLERHPSIRAEIERVTQARAEALQEALAAASG